MTTPEVARDPIHAEIVMLHEGNEIVPTTDAGAVISLIMAILAWSILPIFGSLIALGLARGAKRRIRNSDGQLLGLSIARSAQWLAIANLALFTALTVFLIMFLVNIGKTLF